MVINCLLVGKSCHLAERWGRETLGFQQLQSNGHQVAEHEDNEDDSNQISDFVRLHVC